MTTRTPALFIPAMLLLLAGCTSLDPKADIARAGDTVAARSGVDPLWNQPWQKELASWDGRAPLKVEQAVMLALRNNREIRVQVESIAAARADLVQAGLLPNPVLSVTLRLPVDSAGGSPIVGASVMQSFTALWLRGGRIKSAEAQLNQTVLGVSDQALRLAAEVKTTHTRLVFGQRALAINDQNLGTLRQTIGTIEARVKSGEGVPLDVNRAKQQLAKAEAERMLVELDLNNNRRRMLELMGFASASDAWLAAPEDSPKNRFPRDEAGAMALANGQRLDVAAARLLVEARNADLSTEEKSRLKDLAAGADFERDRDGNKSLGSSVSVGVPVFDWNQAQVAKAGAEARGAWAQYEAVAQRACRETRVAWTEATGLEQLAARYQTDVLAVAEKNLTLAQSSLAAGLADTTVVLDTQREVLEARRTLNDYQRNAALARIALELAVGGQIVLRAS